MVLSMVLLNVMGRVSFHVAGVAVLGNRTVMSGRLAVGLLPAFVERIVQRPNEFGGGVAAREEEAECFIRDSVRPRCLLAFPSLLDVGQLLFCDCGVGGFLAFACQQFPHAL